MVQVQAVCGAAGETWVAGAGFVAFGLLGGGRGRARVRAAVAFGAVFEAEEGVGVAEGAAEVGVHGGAVFEGEGGEGAVGGRVWVAAYVVIGGYGRERGG